MGNELPEDHIESADSTLRTTNNSRLQYAALVWVAIPNRRLVNNLIKLLALTRQSVAIPNQRLVHPIRLQKYCLFYS